MDTHDYVKLGFTPSHNDHSMIWRQSKTLERDGEHLDLHCVLNEKGAIHHFEIHYTQHEWPFHLCQSLNRVAYSEPVILGTKHVFCIRPRHLAPEHYDSFMHALIRYVEDPELGISEAFRNIPFEKPLLGPRTCTDPMPDFDRLGFGVKQFKSYPESSTGHHRHTRTVRRQRGNMSLSCDVEDNWLHTICLHGPATSELLAQTLDEVSAIADISIRTVGDTQLCFLTARNTHKNPMKDQRPLFNVLADYIEHPQHSLRQHMVARYGDTVLPLQRVPRRLRLQASQIGHMYRECCRMFGIDTTSQIIEPLVAGIVRGRDEIAMTLWRLLPDAEPEQRHDLANILLNKINIPQKHSLGLQR